MGSRIITLQRQARELGRLRTGYSVPNEDPTKRPRAVRSQTWIVTSHAEHYVQAAADIWGGQVEKWQPQGNGAAQWRVITQASSLDAILPPGDPLSQAYEAWTKGGAQRRCDGMTESLSDSPCLCRAQWGDAFHETAPRDQACKMTTRLNVILPEMPDIGAWRVETHSYHSANEIAAAVDVLKGSIGDSALIPVRLRIEQRTRVAQGKTKQFPVVAVELRGGTAGQVLAGAVQAPAVGGGSRTAIEAPRTDYVALIRAADSRDAVVAVWEQAKRDGAPNGAEIEAAARARVAEFPQPPASPAAAPQQAPHEDRQEPDRDTVWQQIVAAWPRGMKELEKTFQGAMGVQAKAATAGELASFLRLVHAGKYDDPAPATPAGADEAVPF
ncbi:hypothetical protein [Nonomuraea indica]|uniref:recombination directionality factor n=1 Tax=Nonomuraea indica TaxID=1581193 RepID=UPI000C7E5C7A|nr:hypothetical protein [Nonomuraea indica]